MLKQKFIESEKRCNEFSSQSVSVVIYGMGKRGMRVLKSFWKKEAGTNFMGAACSFR